MRWVVLLLVLLLPGCVNPAEVTAALEAPLPPDGTPFVAFAATCAQDIPAGPNVLVAYPDRTLYHLRLEAAREGVQPNADTQPPFTEAERVALDAAATGALDLERLTDAEGRFLVVHVEKTQVPEAEMSDLRRRVTLAGFPALAAAYGTPGEGACVEDHAAWVEGAHWHVQEVAHAAPWALHHVSDLLIELHDL